MHRTLREELKCEQWLTWGRRGGWFFYMFINCYNFL